MIELAVVRHGRTAWNAERRFQGTADIPLDDEGRAQASALAASGRVGPVTRVFSSPLVRARETAAIVVPGVAPVILADLAEMRFGAWEGKTWDELVAADPSLADERGTDPRVYTPEGGETFAQVCERAERALVQIRARSREGERVAAFTHAGVLHAILAVLLGGENAAALRVTFRPASLSRFALEPDGSARVLGLDEVAATIPAESGA